IGLLARRQRDVALAGLRKLEVGVQDSTPDRHIRASQLNIAVANRREYLTTALCACEQHVQAPLATLRRYGPKALGHIAGVVTSVADGNKHYIAFVALNIFKILHEEGFRPRSVKEVLEFRMPSTK